MEHLTDREAAQALRDAGIPSKFHSKSRTLNEVKPSADILNWISDIRRAGAGTHIEGETVRHLYLYGDAGLDGFYLTGRGLLLTGVPFLLLHLSDLFEGGVLGDATLRERVGAALVIGIAGYNEDGVRLPGPEDRIFAAQWFISRLMDSGKLLLMCGVRPPDEVKDWWGKGFTRRVRRFVHSVCLEYTNESRA